MRKFLLLTVICGYSLSAVAGSTCAERFQTKAEKERKLAFNLGIATVVLIPTVIPAFFTFIACGETIHHKQRHLNAASILSAASSYMQKMERGQEPDLVERQILRDYYLAHTFSFEFEEMVPLLHRLNLNAEHCPHPTSIPLQIKRLYLDERILSGIF